MKRGEWHLRPKGRGSKSGWIGVEKRGGSYRGYVWSGGKKFRTKSFGTAAEAALKRDEWALKAYGGLAVLNFLDEDVSPSQRNLRARRLAEHQD